MFYIGTVHEKLRIQNLEPEKGCVNLWLIYVDCLQTLQDSAASKYSREAGQPFQLVELRCFSILETFALGEHIACCH